MLLVLFVLPLDVLFFVVGIIQYLGKDFLIVFSLAFDFSLELLSLVVLSFHHGSMLINDLIDILVVSLDDISNDFLKVMGFLLFLGLQLLEFGGIVEHPLRVAVPVLIQLLLVPFFKFLDLLLSNVLCITLVLHEGIITISVLKSGT